MSFGKDTAIKDVWLLSQCHCTATVGTHHVGASAAVSQSASVFLKTKQPIFNCTCVRIRFMHQQKTFEWTWQYGSPTLSWKFTCIVKEFLSRQKNHYIKFFCWVSLKSPSGSTVIVFNVVPGHTIRTKSKNNIRICECWKRSHHIYVNSECLCSNVLVRKHASAAWTRINKLEYVNYCFLPEKWSGRALVEPCLPSSAGLQCSLRLVPQCSISPLVSSIEFTIQ